MNNTRRNEIAKLADEAARLSGKTIQQLRRMVRDIRAELADNSQDRDDMIVNYCGEDAEDDQCALRALMRAAV